MYQKHFYMQGSWQNILHMQIISSWLWTTNKSSKHFSINQSSDFDHLAHNFMQLYKLFEDGLLIIYLANLLEFSNLILKVVPNNFLVSCKIHLSDNRDELEGREFFQSLFIYYRWCCNSHIFQASILNFYFMPSKQCIMWRQL